MRAIAARWPFVLWLAIAALLLLLWVRAGLGLRPLPPPPTVCSHAGREGSAGPVSRREFVDALSPLLVKGVRCFDLDVSGEGGTLLLGHPADVAQWKGESAERYSLPLFLQLLADNPGVRATLEPKPAGLFPEVLAAVRSAPSDVASRVALVVPMDVGVHHRAAEGGRRALLALPLRDVDGCAPLGEFEVPPSLAAFDVVMPSVTCWRRPEVRALVRAAQPASPLLGAWVWAWTVDDVGTLCGLGGGVWAVSNVAGRLRSTVCSGG